MEGNTVGYLAIGEGMNAFSCLRIPELDGTVVRGGQEARPIRTKLCLLDGFFMPKECPETPTIMINIPELHRGGRGRGEGG